MTKAEFNSNFIHFFKILHNYAYKLTNNMDDALDLVQETAYKAFKNREKFRENNNLKAWLMTIMKNIFINDYRKKSKRNTILDNSEDQYMLEKFGPSIDNFAQNEITMKELFNIINELENEVKIPFMMHYEGYKYQEIADHLGIPLGTVKSRIFFARQELKRKILRKYDSLEVAMN